MAQRRVASYIWTLLYPLSLFTASGRQTLFAGDDSHVHVGVVDALRLHVVQRETGVQRHRRWRVVRLQPALGARQYGADGGIVGQILYQDIEPASPLPSTRSPHCRNVGDVCPAAFSVLATIKQEFKQAEYG